MFATVSHLFDHLGRFFPTPRENVKGWFLHSYTDTIHTQKRAQVGSRELGVRGDVVMLLQEMELIITRNHYLVRQPSPHASAHGTLM